MQDVRGGTSRLTGPTGKRFITMAPATRFAQWKAGDLFERINATLNELGRKRVGRMPTPDSQSRSADAVKLSSMIGEERGLDPNKRVNGRKREFIVDTQGRLARSCSRGQRSGWSRWLHAGE